TRAAALAALLLAGACSTQQPARVEQWPLALGVFFAAELPNDWSAEASFADMSRTSLLRLTSRLPGTTQLRLEPRLTGRPAGDPLEAARREIASSRVCDGVGAARDEQRAGRNVIVSCSRPRDGTAPLLPVAAGVLVRDELVLRFAMLGVSDDEAV